MLTGLRATKLAQGQELTVIKELLNRLTSGVVSFMMWNYESRMDYLWYNEYIFKEDTYSGKYHLTEKGINFIKERCVQLVRMQLSHEQLIQLIYFLPAEALPKYLSHESDKVREAAKKRMDEI